MVKFSLKKFQEKFWTALIETTKQFLERTTLHGLKYLIGRKGHKLERLLWTFIIMTSVLASIYVALYAWFNISLNPIYTTLITDKYDVSHIQFPSVTVCNNNQISRRSAIEYANKLYKQDKNFTIDWYLNSIHLLGNLIDFNDDNSKVAEFQNVLNDNDIDEFYGKFNIENRMKMLTPKCEELLLKCQWNTKTINCSDVFSMQSTMDGYCCTFNDLRYESENLQSKQILKNHLSGLNSGLFLLLNASTADYFFTSKNIIGFTIGIFTPRNYPDDSVTRLRQHIVNPNTASFIKIKVKKIKSTPDVEQISIPQRKCYFKNELRDEFTTFYSQSHCLMKCKIEHVLEFCNCIPFYWPAYLLNNNGIHLEQCTLSDLKCLSQYKAILNSYATNDQFSQTNAIDCNHCLPLCTNQVYDTRQESAPIETIKIYEGRDQWSKITHNESLSIVRIFYTNDDAVLYGIDVEYGWYEIIGYFGGLLGIFLGFSIITILEIIYVYTIKLYQNFKQNKKIIKKNVKTLKNQKIKSYSDMENILLMNTNKIINNEDFLASIKYE